MRRKTIILICIMSLLSSNLLLSCSRTADTVSEAEPKAEIETAALQTEIQPEDTPETGFENTGEAAVTKTGADDNSSIGVPDTCHEIAAQISRFMSQYRAVSTFYDESAHLFYSSIITETRHLSDISTEGGTITRYMDKNGKLYRYRLNIYGETGRMENNYFFTDNFVYYTSLHEEYCVPANLTKGSVDILEQTLTEGILPDETCYRYDRVRDQILIDHILDSVYTEEELADLYENGTEHPETNKGNNDTILASNLLYEAIQMTVAVL